jgi:hypothetical protein
MNKVIAVLALAFVTLANSVLAAETPSKWKRWNAAPYATSQKEACKKAPVAIDGFSLPAPVKAHFKQAVGITCKSDKNVWLTPDMSLKQMLSGPDARYKVPYVMNNVPVAELPVLKSPDGRAYPKGSVAQTAKALSWSWAYEGKTYVLYLPYVCWNWSWEFGPPPPPRPAPPPPPVIPPPAALPPAVSLRACYTIPFDYRNTPGVVWDDRHRTHVSAHLDATEAELESVYNDFCFGVVDSTGFKKPFRRCESCIQGEYPPAKLARAVGLLADEPKGALSFYLQDGVGNFSLPLSWAARWMLFCVDVKAYPVSVPGYEDLQAVSRFDVVEKVEIERTLKGSLDRTLSGAGHY